VIFYRFPRQACKEFVDVSDTLDTTEYLSVAVDDFSVTSAGTMEGKIGLSSMPTQCDSIYLDRRDIRMPETRLG
jgi:hypothetical protein